MVQLPVARASCELDWPLRGKVTRGFELPVGAYGEGGHQGMDIAAPPGSKVSAAAAGTVTWVGELPRGTAVSITHQGNTRTTYLGLASVCLRQGDMVSRGQEIGTLDGARDPSSAGTHLHFGAYLNGSPVDPRLLMGSFDAAEYIRLCPAAGGETAKRAPGVIDGKAGGGLLRAAVSPFKSAVKAIGGGCVAMWAGARAAAGRVGGFIAGAWDGALCPVLRTAGRWAAAGARWCWTNRYVKAVVAGIAAAVVIVGAIVIVVLTLPVSLTVALVASIAAALACIGTAIYFAATHPHGFSFLSCFFKSLSAGVAAAAAALSMGSLGAAFSAGWAEMGLLGALKYAAGNGLLSMVFEGGTSYLFTGAVSMRRMATAFLIGAISGPVAKALKEGVVGSRLVQALIINVSEGGASFASRTAVLFLHKSGAAWHGMLTVLKDGATAFGGKAVYLLFTGTFGVCTNLVSCMLNHRPITFSGMLSSFVTGAVMGGVGLLFGGKGLDGLFSKVGFLKDGFGRVLRKGLSKLVNKSISRSLGSMLRSRFNRVFKESRPAFTEEE